MPDDKLSTKPQIDTTDFKTGISQMNRELRVLESGFRASAASLGDWANDATGLETRIKSLNSQMDIQRQKVAATRAEYERIKTEKGETSKAAQDLEIKLNKETETLNKMERELGDTESALQEVTTGETEVADAADDMGDQVEDSGSKMESLRGAMAGIGTIAAGVATAVLAIGAAALAALIGLGKLVFDTAGAAAELVDLSTQTGINTTRLQELQYAGDQVGTSLDTITGSQARLIRSMATAQDQAKKFNDELESGKDPADLNLGEMDIAFRQLGISVTDASGNLRDQQDVFAETIDALGKIENPAERDALAMQIFGKSAQELNPLIKAGSAELNRLSQEAHDVGAVMSEDTVAGLEAFDDTMSSIQSGLKGTIGTLAAQFLPVFKTAAKALQDLFKSDEFKQRIQQITEALQGMVQIVTTVLGQLLSGDVQGALITMFGADRGAQLFNFFSAVNSFIQDTLIPFVTAHAKEIKAALIGIGAAIAAAGLISGILAIGSAIAALANPVGLIIAAVGLLAAAWTGNWFGIRDTLTEVWENFLQPIIQGIIEFFSKNIPVAIQFLSDIWTGTLLPAIQAVWSFLSNNIFPLFRAIINLIKAVFSAELRLLAGIWQNVLYPALQKVWGFLNSNVLPVFRTIAGYIRDTLQPILTGLATFVKNVLVAAFNGIVTAIQSAITWLKNLADRINNLTLPDWLTPGSPTPFELGLIGINKAMQELNVQLPTLAKGLDLQMSGNSGSSVQNDDFRFFAPVIIQGSTPAGSLGARLKGRRY